MIQGTIQAVANAIAPTRTCGITVIDTGNISILASQEHDDGVFDLSNTPNIRATKNVAASTSARNSCTKRANPSSTIAA
jgi:hypothetical protein